MQRMQAGDYDPDTGEVIEQRAADGLPMPRKAVTVADTLRLLADGQFDLDASENLRMLVKKLEAHAFTNRGVSKGLLVFEREFP